MFNEVKIFFFLSDCIAIIFATRDVYMKEMNIESIAVCKKCTFIQRESRCYSTP